MTIPHVPRDVYNTIATIMTSTVGVGELGEISRSHGAIVEWPARLDKYRYTGSTSAWAEQGIVDIPTHKLYLPPEAVISPGDQVLVEGITYEVIEAYEPGGMRHHKEVWLKRGQI